jgi:hypothetical protein
MRTKPGVPLADRAGPVTPSPAAVPPVDGVEPPPGTACWITHGHTRLPGVVLGWQCVEGQWHALVSAWIPRSELEPRTTPEP